VTGRFYAGLVPWLVFGVVVRAGGHGFAWASASALGAAIVVAIAAQRSARVTSLNVCGVALFAVFLAVGLGWSNVDDVDAYARALAVGALGLFFFGSLPFDPLVAPYIRELVSQTQWDHSDFRRGSQALTVIWGATAMVIAASHAVAGAISTSLAFTMFNWLIPIAVLGGAVHLATLRYNAYFDEDSMSGVVSLLD
jgi:hypothetical protein